MSFVVLDLESMRRNLIVHKEKSDPQLPHLEEPQSQTRELS